MAGILFEPEADCAGDPVAHPHGFEILFGQRGGHIVVGDPIEILDRVDGAARKGAMGEFGIEAGLFRRCGHRWARPAVERDVFKQHVEQCPALRLELFPFLLFVAHPAGFPAAPAPIVAVPVT